MDSIVVSPLSTPKPIYKTSKRKEDKTKRILNQKDARMAFPPKNEIIIQR